MRAIILFTLTLMAFCSGACAEVRIDLKAIAQIESSGNPKAFNRAAGARGLYQLTPVVIKEFNRFNKTHYEPEDAFYPVVAEHIADWYLHKRIPQMLKHFRIKDSVESRLVCWNAGIARARTMRLPKETQKYLKKYNQLTRRNK